LSASATQLTLQPGQSTWVRLTLDASNPATVNQPGTYTASLNPQDDTPYGSDPVDVALRVLPPPTWGEISGTVRGAACGGSTTPLSGASVQIISTTGGHALTTDVDGHYALWLKADRSSLTTVASDQGWQSQTGTATISARRTTTADFTLQPVTPCG
jgi:hypothetical protein